MKIALLGGTFNPLHNGHIKLAREVRNQLDYNKIIFVPSNIPPHKQVSDSITAEERLHMLKIALSDYDWADFSDCEIVRKGVSYTADTLRFIQEYYNLSDKPGLIIGDDLAMNFSSWRDTSAILEMADMIIAHRMFRERLDLSFPHRYVDNEIFSLSSSEIRKLVLEGGDISGIVPSSIIGYINEREFYRGETGNN